MSDESEYGTHQHASPGAVRTHTLAGEPTGLVTVNQSVVGASPAAHVWSTAPYKKKVPPPPPKPELCAREKCRGSPVTGTLYCRWHQDEPPVTA